METLLRDDSWNPWSGRASALSNLRFCLLLALSSRIGWIVSIYNRGAKLAIFYGILCFSGPKCVVMCLLFCALAYWKIKKGHH